MKFRCWQIRGGGVDRDCFTEMIKTSALYFLLYCRHANIGDAPLGHSANVGQCAPVVLFRLLHFWDRRCSTMARHTKAALLHPQGHKHNLAQVSVHPKFINPHHVAITTTLIV